MLLVDAHNHLQDSRLAPYRSAIISECRQVKVGAAVVNGTHPSDWGAVTDLASQHAWIIPSFGCHPWFLDGLPDDWREQLRARLSIPRAIIGEIGLDHWKPGLDRRLQEEVFLDQLAIARSLNVPVTIHGLKAWERLLSLLRGHAPPAAGFLLHSYSGPLDLIPAFVELGGYFSCAPAFLAPNRSSKLAVFRSVPIERLLPESDAPDQAPPSDLDLYGLKGAQGERLNHPAHVVVVYRGLSELLAIHYDELADVFRANFGRLFGIAPSP